MASFELTYATYNIAWSESRSGFLDQVFAVVGGGYEWQNGELVHKVPCDREVIAETIAEKGFRLPDHWEPENTMKGYFGSSLHEYSNICNLPKDIKSDWLDAAEEFIKKIDKAEIILIRSKKDRKGTFRLVPKVLTRIKELKTLRTKKRAKKRAKIKAAETRVKNRVKKAKTNAR